MIRVKFGTLYHFNPSQVQEFMVAVIDSVFLSVSTASLISNTVLVFLVVDMIGLQFFVLYVVCGSLLYFVHVCPH